jgi:hypothetical protein
MHSSVESDEPTSVKATLLDDRWATTMNKEYEALMNNKTVILFLLSLTQTS